VAFGGTKAAVMTDGGGVMIAVLKYTEHSAEQPILLEAVSELVRMLAEAFPDKATPED